MAIFSQYGTGQRFGFALVCVGFTLCLIGSIAPYWVTAEKSTDTFNIKLISVRIGVWYYCAELLGEETCYSFYTANSDEERFDDKNRFNWINVIRLTVVINIILSLLSGLIACCRSLCCSGGRTICHGILSFIAGVSGITAVVIAYQKTHTLVDLPIVEVDYGWALWMFTFGSVSQVIASLLLCFGAPREMYGGQVMSNPLTSYPTSAVSVTSSTVNQYQAGGQIAFEPLPTSIPVHGQA